MFIDSDDFVPDGVMDELMSRIHRETKRKISIYQGDWQTVDSNSKIISDYSCPSGLSGYPWGKIFHFSVLEHFQFPEGYWFEDTPITYVLGGMPVNIEHIEKSIYCYRINPNGISNRSQYYRKSVDSYWITEQCLNEFESFHVKYDQRAYEYLLRQSIVNYIRTKRQPRSVRKAIFVLTIDLKNRYFSELKSRLNTDIEAALDGMQFRKFEMLATARAWEM